ncbi:MAG: tetratricopeptide repeat protein, partial [Thermoguttaceae bacterium]
SPSALWELIRIVPFFLVSAVLTIVNLWFQTHGSGEVIRAAGFPERLQGAGSVVWFYLYKAIFPLNLAFIYPPWSIQSNSLLWWLPLAGALLVTAVFLRYEKTWARALLFAWGFFCTALVPVLGFVDIAFMKFTLVADHYQHIAIIGVIALATAGWSIWRQQIRGALRGTATLLAIGTVISLMSLSYRQNKLYCDAPTLYRATLQKNPKCWILHNNLGALMFQSGRVSEAIEHYHVALRENPDYADAHNNLGYALSQTGRVREAIRHYKTALRLKPVFPEVNNNLGLALAKAGHLPEAIVQYRLALRLQNDNPVFHLNLANALDEMNQETEAINHFKIALRLNPAYADAYNNLAVAFYKTDRLSEAIACLRQAIKLKSNNVDAYYNLTLAYAKANRQAEALLAAKTGLHMARMLNLPDKIKLFEDCLQPAAASASGHSKAPP